MKYRLKEDHQVRLSDKMLKAGVYTLQELEKSHEHDSLTFCLEHTKLKNKIELLVANETNDIKEINDKPKKGKK